MVRRKIVDKIGRTQGRWRPDLWYRQPTYSRANRPEHWRKEWRSRYPLPKTLEDVAAERERRERVRDFRIPLEGHAQGKPLPPLADDPRLRTSKRRKSSPRRPPDMPKEIMREGQRNPLGARLPSLLPDETSLLAHKIWLPNLRVFLLRNGPAHAGDPYTATFRVPRQLNKPDIAQYLRQVYGVGMNGIRTSISWGDIIRKPGHYRSIERKKVFKKAIIQLNEPFLYPAEHNPYYLNKHFGVPVYGMRTSSDEVSEPGKETSWEAIRERAGRARLQAERDIVDAMRIRRHREALARGWTDDPIPSSQKVDDERGEEALIQQEIEAAERASMEAAMRDQSIEYAIGEPENRRRAVPRPKRRLLSTAEGQRARVEA